MKLAWGARVSPEFRRKVAQLCELIAVDPNALMACMAFETGRTFSPSVRNPSSSATGLIQFMDATARGLGTTVDALARMSGEEQLDWVYRYFRGFAGRLPALSDVYMAILWPKAIGLPESAVIFPPGSREFLVNRGLDLDHDGAVTKAEAASKVAALLAEGLAAGNLYDSDLDPLSAAPRTTAAPIDDRDLSHLPPRVDQAPTPETKPMLPFLLPLLAELIPQVAKILIPTGGSEVAQRNQALANTVLDTVVATVKTETAKAEVTPAGAVAAIANDPELLRKVREAVLTHPDIMEVLEVGGGVVKAREHDLATMQADKPFWKASAVFWVSVLLVPLVFWYVGASIVGGVTIPEAWPWYAQLPLKLFGMAWDSGAKVGLANLVVGLVLGGICGVYYGVSVTQQKQSGGMEKST
jgi:hypothetical protein